MDLNPIEVQTHLKGVDYPASKADVVAKAEENDAPQEVIEALQQIEAEQFDGPDDVMAELG
jgi:Protein of unknown function (DUF2795)